MTEDSPGLLPDLARHGRAFAGHPARDRERGDGADAHEAVFDGIVEGGSRILGATADPRDHIVGPRAERLAEAAQLLGIDRRRRLHRRRRIHPVDVDLSRTHNRADRQFVRVTLRTFPYR